MKVGKKATDEDEVVYSNLTPVRNIVFFRGGKALTVTRSKPLQRRAYWDKESKAYILYVQAWTEEFLADCGGKWRYPCRHPMGCKRVGWQSNKER